MTSGKKYWADATPVVGMQFEYGFDSIGNRSSSKAGGDAQGGSLRPSSYMPNSLNQYTQRTVPGAVDILGTANAAATVSVNDQATYRKGDYFQKALTLNNSAAPVYSTLNVVGVKNGAGPGGTDVVTLKSGSVYLPKTPEPFTYDADGNLTSDGRWTYTWDAENRLIKMEAIAAVPLAAKQKLEFAYDYMGRRIQKLVYSWDVPSSSYQLQSTIKFLYDGWNLVAELEGQNALIRSYVWGQDLSGSLQGAGGIGGLLIVAEGSERYLPSYGGNGNVTSLVKAAAGTLAGIYEYGPFGESLQSTEDYSEQNPIRFSTKYEDVETGMLYYGYRYYSATAGRWISRDSIDEQGGINLYVFVLNRSTNLVDVLGQAHIDDRNTGIVEYGLNNIRRYSATHNDYPYPYGMFKGHISIKGSPCVEKTKGCWKADIAIEIRGYAFLPFKSDFPYDWMYNLIREHEVGHLEDLKSVAAKYLSLSTEQENKWGTFIDRHKCESYADPWADDIVRKAADDYSKLEVARDSSKFWNDFWIWIFNGRLH